MKNPEFLKRVELGPLGCRDDHAASGFAMGKRLVQWFIYSIVVGVVAAHAAAPLLGPGTPYRTVFHTVALVAFAGYALALWQSPIWKSTKWSTTLKATFDGLLYALGNGRNVRVALAEVERQARGGISSGRFPRLPGSRRACLRGSKATAS